MYLGVIDDKDWRERKEGKAPRPDGSESKVNRAKSERGL